jgi:predicted porin
VAYLHSDRDGSPFLTTYANNGTFGANLIAPVSMADRKRDKYRLSMNWDPLEELSLQFIADHARDKYESRTFLGKGVSNGKAENFGVDATYTFSPNLNVTAWYSRNDTRSDQATCATLTVVAATGAMTCPASQMANLSNVNDSVGLGLRGKPRERWEMGADFSFSEIGDKYKQAALTGAAVNSLPDVATRISSAKMFVKYDVKKNAAIRLNYMYDRISTNDWTWTNFTYSDGTKVYRDPNQHVQFVGLTYIYKWQ